MFVLSPAFVSSLKTIFIFLDPIDFLTMAFFFNFRSDLSYEDSRDATLLFSLYGVFSADIGGGYIYHI